MEESIEATSGPPLNISAYHALSEADKTPLCKIYKQEVMSKLLILGCWFCNINLTRVTIKKIDNKGGYYKYIKIFLENNELICSSN